MIVPEAPAEITIFAALPPLLEYDAFRLCPPVVVNAPRVTFPLDDEIMIGAALLAGPTELFAPKDEIVCKVMSEVALTKILPDEEDELTAAVVTMVPLTPLVIVPVVAFKTTLPPCVSNGLFITREEPVTVNLPLA